MTFMSLLYIQESRYIRFYSDQQIHKQNMTKQKDNILNIED